jgi:2-keto-4-pentenoate hydratase/2-oxohepta-3-ene-1,7-dioic acid hydratase in catechol pathway
MPAYAVPGWLERFGRPAPEKIICIGLNYREHAAETGAALPAEPLMFAKFATTLIGSGDEIVLPPEATHVDAEAELAVVIGAPGRRLTAERARDVIAGYIAANDVSARNLQYGDGQWTRGKGFDTFCPVGPRFVPVDDLDPSDLRIVQRLNGEVMQDGRTGDLIFDVPTLVAHASSVFTLAPGDLILTGTPAGVGWARKSPVSLQAGDVVEVEVEGIGVLRNPVVAEEPR